MKRLIRGLLQRAGYDIVRTVSLRDALRESLSDLSPDEQAIVERVRPYTMTSPERLAALIGAVNHVCRQGIAGDFAECGVWRGGSMMAAALTLLARGDTSRTLYLYDTFTGMTPPGPHDRRWDGTPAQALYAQADPDGWCRAGLDEVRANLRSTGYPSERIRFVEGRVEETIPAQSPARLALLRLDTDWYESTRHELEHLYPRLERGGVLIIDDYGYFEGARKAVDEYFGAHAPAVFMHRIDSTGRLIVKTGD